MRRGFEKSEPLNLAGAFLDKFLDKYFWIKDLILAEQEMEEKGIIDVGANAVDPDKSLERHTIDFLMSLKAQFTEAANTYNNFKKNQHNHIKIYGVSKTLADFMLFRNGFKLIFSMKTPGTLVIYSSQLPTGFVPNQTEDNMSSPVKHVIQAKWGAFDDLSWTFKSDVINAESLVKYYLSTFIRYSSNH